MWTTTVRCRAERHHTVCTMWPDISSISFIVRCRAIRQRVDAIYDFWGVVIGFINQKCELEFVIRANSRIPGVLLWKQAWILHFRKRHNDHSLVLNFQANFLLNRLSDTERKVTDSDPNKPRDFAGRLILLLDQMWILQGLNHYNRHKFYIFGNEIMSTILSWIFSIL